MEHVTTIREQLPYGAIKRIAQKTGKSISTVNRVIDGNSSDNEVLAELGKEIRAEKKRQQKAQQLRTIISAY